MRDCCQDKTSPYDIREEESDLIRACIDLGDWLLRRPEITLSEAQSVREVQKFLEDLPSPPKHGLHGEYGFKIEPDVADWDEGHLGCWAVSVCRAMFEIYSCHNDTEEGDLEWLLCPGHKNHNYLLNAKVWISEVAFPEELLDSGQRLVIEASAWSVKDADKPNRTVEATPLRSLPHL